MASRMIWGLGAAALAGLAYMGYKRGMFDDAGLKMRQGMDRVKEGLEAAGQQVQSGVRSATDQIRKGMEGAKHQVQDRISHSTEGADESNLEAAHRNEPRSGQF